MIIQSIEFSKRVNELLDVLRDDIGRMERNVQKLKRLQVLVIKRDIASLEKMLNEIKTESDDYTDNEQRRKSARAELAEILMCEAGQITLSRLEKLVSEEQRVIVFQTKAQLQDLVRRLSAEHKNTVSLMSELERFNRLMLDTILGRAESRQLTYNSGGATRYYGDAAFVSFQL